MSSNKKYWKSVEELNENSSVVEALKQKEFVQEIPVDEFLGDKETLETSSTSRRDFLKYVGFSTAAASLAACEGPVIKSIPYVVQPDQIIPGVANYYASTIANGYDFASVLVKTREGRPIQIQNNELALTNGGANARVNASVLDLYDSQRVAGPKKNGDYSSWTEFDSDTISGLNDAVTNGKDIVLLTQTFASPSTSKLIAEFKEKYNNVKHVIYDAISESATADAYENKYGVRGLANYDFSKASTIISVGADFLGDWQGGGFDSGYSKSRIPSHGEMSRHTQFESNMTLSGANADKRVPIKPSEQKVVLAKIFGAITQTQIPGKLADHIQAAVDTVVAELRSAGKNAVVVSGVQDVNAQALVLAINEALKSNAFEPHVTIKTRQGNNADVMALVNDMNAGSVGALIMCGVNPVYSLPNSEDFISGLSKTDMTVSFSMKEDETSSRVQYIAALPHYLESWGDVEMKTGHYGLVQPTIRPLFDTKQFQEALLLWNGNTATYHDYIKNHWTSDILGETSWNDTLHDGVYVSDANDK